MRLAIYKVCWAKLGCVYFDIVDGVDKEVKDGVDILSIFLGRPPRKYANDLVAIDRVVSHYKEMFLCVSFRWTSLCTGKLVGNQHYLPIGDVGNARYISNFSNSNLVKGKIWCPEGLIVEKNAGTGVVIAKEKYRGESLTSEPYLFSGIAITYYACEVCISRDPYWHTGANSDRPSITAPGVDTFATWLTEVSPSRVLEDPRKFGFNIISGTSMARPHVSGVVALIKGAHSDWPLAMIISALMTTTYNHCHDDKTPLLDQAV
ncbi:LOW QUALITY PROTEIN: hypothetical protein Cgig2_005741 [Carnegiea gigantea]|uniref:Peptidase S8/S53 domain-containing protein n=1 Tax=Carnegiea gigantea TaxID=171969 RepID=A0A9Q1QK74_9CARY|nr:LOW QUALITY PROTEIN: hypothetical protein Cgig2_005741 [Carnegiea gigantea]